jgi:long-chain acyl-CoA synthetase
MILTNLAQMLVKSTIKHNLRPAINTHTYDSIFKLSNTYAHIFREKQLIKNNCICVAGEKSFEWVALMLATWRTGNIFVPLPTNNKILSNHIIDTVQPKLIFTDNVTNNNDISLYNWQPTNAYIHDRYNEPYEPALVLFTSGSTNNPKGVVLSHENILSNLEGIQKKYDGVITCDDTSFSILPWHHCYGLVCELLFLLQNGAQIHLPESKEPREIFKEIKGKSPTLFFAVPKVLENIYKKDIRFIPNFIKKRLLFGKNLRMISVGGAYCNPELIHFINKTYNTQVYQGYGMSETSPMISLNSVGNNKIGSVGKLLNNTEVSFTEDKEILVSSPSVMSGYLRSDLTIDTTKIVNDEKEWFKTGDTGYLDEDGYLFITGRNNSKYKLSNGKYVEPQYLENILMLSKIIEHVVIYGTEFNVAIVQSKADRITLLKEIHNILKNKVEDYEIPKEVIIVDEPFTIDNKLLTQKLEPNRKLVIKKYFELSKSFST